MHSRESGCDVATELRHVFPATGRGVEAEAVDVEVERTRSGFLGASAPGDGVPHDFQFADAVTLPECGELASRLPLQDRETVIVEAIERPPTAIAAASDVPGELDRHGGDQDGLQLGVPDDGAGDERWDRYPESGVVGVAGQELDRSRGWQEGNGRGGDDIEEPDDEERHKRGGGTIDAIW